MPFPFAKTRVFAVPRSMARSEEIRLKTDLKFMNERSESAQAPSERNIGLVLAAARKRLLFKWLPFDGNDSAAMDGTRRSSICWRVQPKKRNRIRRLRPDRDLGRRQPGSSRPEGLQTTQTDSSRRASHGCCQGAADGRTYVLTGSTGTVHIIDGNLNRVASRKFADELSDIADGARRERRCRYHVGRAASLSKSTVCLCG